MTDEKVLFQITRMPRREYVSLLFLCAILVLIGLFLPPIVFGVAFLVFAFFVINAFGTIKITDKRIMASTLGSRLFGGRLEINLKDVLGCVKETDASGEGYVKIVLKTGRDPRTMDQHEIVVANLKNLAGTYYEEAHLLAGDNSDVIVNTLNPLLIYDEPILG